MANGGPQTHNFLSIYSLDDFELLESTLAPKINGKSVYCAPQNIKLYSGSGFNTLWYIKGNPNPIYEGDSLDFFINQTSTFYATHDGFKDSFTVTIVNRPSMMLKDTFFFTGNSYIAFYPNNGFRFQWNNNSTDTLNPKKYNTEGLHILRLTSLENCVYFDSFNLKEINPSFKIIADTMICQYNPYSANTNVAKEMQWFYNQQLLYESSSLNMSADIIGTHQIKACYDTMGYTFCDSINLTVVEQPSSKLPKEIVFCKNDPQKICPQVLPISATMLWWDNSNIACKTFSQQGVYTLAMNNQGCLKTDTLITKVLPIPQFKIFQNDTPCLDGQNFTLLQIVPDTFKSFNWQPSGNKNISFINYDTSSHIITVTGNNNCFNSIRYKPINNCKMTLFVPTAFSPNKNGNNDVFKVQGHYIQTVEMSIYNRWGEKVFETKDLNEAWDGSYKGEIVQEGIYLVKLKITSMPQANGQTPHAYYEMSLTVLR